MTELLKNEYLTEETACYIQYKPEQVARIRSAESLFKEDYIDNLPDKQQ